MDLWNLFKRKKKIKTGICFSNEKSVEELLKNFLETYADKINTVSLVLPVSSFSKLKQLLWKMGKS